MLCCAVPGIGPTFAVIIVIALSQSYKVLKKGSTCSYWGQCHLAPAKGMELLGTGRELRVPVGWAGRAVCLVPSDEMMRDERWGSCYYIKCV